MQEEQISNSMENRFAYAKGNYEAMREKLMGANLAARIQALGVQEAWDLLAGEIQAAVGEFVPVAKRRGAQKKKPLWLNEKALGKIKKKRAAYRRYIYGD